MPEASSRRVVQYTRGTNVQDAGVTSVVNIQDSQEQAPCATYWFLRLIQVPHEAPVYIVGREGSGRGLPVREQCGRRARQWSP
eukprot:5297327-Pyramimonas_sp.AAC.4